MRLLKMMGTLETPQDVCVQLRCAKVIELRQGLVFGRKKVARRGANAGYVSRESNHFNGRKLLKTLSTVLEETALSILVPKINT